MPCLQSPLRKVPRPRLCLGHRGCPALSRFSILCCVKTAGTSLWWGSRQNPSVLPGGDHERVTCQDQGLPCVPVPWGPGSVPGMPQHFCVTASCRRLLRNEIGIFFMPFFPTFPLMAA